MLMWVLGVSKVSFHFQGMWVFAIVNLSLLFFNFHLVAEKMRNSYDNFQYSFVYFTCGYLIRVVLFMGLTEVTCWKCLDFLYKVHCPVAFVGFNSYIVSTILPFCSSIMPSV